MKNCSFLLYGLLSLFPNRQYPEKTPCATPQNQQKHVEDKLMPDDATGASFFDDFSGSLSGQWLGDIASFNVADGSLWLREQAKAPASIAVPSTRLQNTVWEAGILVDGAFTTSNYIRLYVAATTRSPHAAQQGYHLQIDGGNSHHVYRLWRQNGRTRSLVFESSVIPNQGDKFRARIRVICTNKGHWQILADEYDSGSFEAVSGKDGQSTIVDNTYRIAGYSGYFVNFSPTRWRDFKLDYLLIKPFDPTANPDPTDILQPGDVLINEILSNPKPDGADFVEIYNYSNKTVNLAQLEIASLNSNVLAGTRRKITGQPLFLYPNEYKVLTAKPAIVKQHYPRSDFHTFIEMPMLPNFNNETGGAVLYSDNLVVDSLFYTPTMQSPFIIDHKGVSLERQHFSEPTNAPGNFRSAAVSVGGATPGYQNSLQPAGATKEDIFLTTKTFSPDSDGFEDQLEINYRFPTGGFMANIDIYTDKGLLVKRLQRNQSLATQGTIVWDGLSDANQRLPVGIYIAVIEIYHADGMQKVYRKSFALAAKL